MGRYKINSTINDQFKSEFTYLNEFGIQEDDGEWYVYQTKLDQIDRSGFTPKKTIEQACQNLFGKSQSEYFDPLIDTFYQNYLLQKVKNEDGFDLYEKIIGDINTEGGIPGLLDDSIPVYITLTGIRMMLKDGMFETALRYWVTDIQPASPFSSEQNDKYQQWIEDLCVKYGTSAAVISALKTVPKGQL